MSERIWMVYPDLPGQRIHVRPAGVAVRQASGWQVDGEHAGEYLTRHVAQARDVLARAGWTVTPPLSEEPETAPASEPRRRRRSETSEEKE